MGEYPLITPTLLILWALLTLVNTALFGEGLVQQSREEAHFYNFSSRRLVKGLSSRRKADHKHDATFVLRPQLLCWGILSIAYICTYSLQLWQSTPDILGNTIAWTVIVGLSFWNIVCAASGQKASLLAVITGLAMALMFVYVTICSAIPSSSVFSNKPALPLTPSLFFFTLWQGYAPWSFSMD